MQAQVHWARRWWAVSGAMGPRGARDEPHLSHFSGLELIAPGLPPVGFKEYLHAVYDSQSTLMLTRPETKREIHDLPGRSSSATACNKACG
jgi:hypothetical protein